MSELLSKIKEDQKHFRKMAIQQKNDLAKVKASVLTTLIGEIETKTKGTGKEASDSDVLKTIKKFVDNINETMKVKEDIDGSMEIEKITLNQYVPKQLTEIELREAISNYFDAENERTLKMGEIMGFLKSDYEGRYDGALASSIIKEMLK